MRRPAYVPPGARYVPPPPPEEPELGSAAHLWIALVMIVFAVAVGVLIWLFSDAATRPAGPGHVTVTHTVTVTPTTYGPPGPTGGPL